MMQVTSYVAHDLDVERLQTDIDHDIASGADILLEKRMWTPVIGDGDVRCYETWLYAVWAYHGRTADNPYPHQVWNHVADGPEGWWTAGTGGETDGPAAPARRARVVRLWLLKGITGTEAGWMDLHDGNPRFATPQRVVFDVPRAEVTQIALPRYYFGGGVKLHAAGQAYRLSFVLPNGAAYAKARGMAAVGDLAALSIVASKAHDIGSGRAVGRRWRELLGAAARARRERGRPRRARMGRPSQPTARAGSPCTAGDGLATGSSDP
jgi:hypothetical protein